MQCTVLLVLAAVVTFSEASYHRCCEWTSWEGDCKYPDCKQTRHRVCHLGSYIRCPGGNHYEDERDCYDCTPECDCHCTHWSEWSDCDCYKHKKYRTRECKPTYCSHSNDCPEIEYMDCKPKYGKWRWGKWSGCKYDPCGKETKTQICKTTKEHPCPCKGEPKSRTRKCNRKGKWSSWSEWSDCTVTCGGGMRERTRTCGPCPYSRCRGHDKETEKCNEQCCPKDCVCKWTDWSKCEKPYYCHECSCGKRERWYKCTPASYCSKKCPDDQDEERDCCEYQ